MSTFKLKPEKIKYVSEIQTLDEAHKKIISEFQKRKRMLPMKKKKLIDLNNKLKLIEQKNGKEFTNEDIKLRSTLKSDIKALEEEIYDIENNISEIEYYSKTDELLMDYYDILNNDEAIITPILNQLYHDNNNNDNNNDNNNNHNNNDNSNKQGTFDSVDYSLHINIVKKEQNINSDKLDKLDILNMRNKEKKKQKKVTRRRKRRTDTNNTSDILSYFGCADTNTKTIDVESTAKLLKDKSILLDHYRSLTDNEYLCEKNKNKVFIKVCEQCGIDKTINQAEGSIVCQNCGISEMIIIETERPNYKDSIPDKPGYPYKRINHFNEWLSQFQAKESTEIPKEVYDSILAELHKNTFYDLKKLTLPYMKKILKKLGITQQYEHATHIISKLSGLPPPTINRETEEELRKMFRMIQIPFEKHCPKGRINFLSYSYVLHKFCQLLELDEFTKCFPLLKSREKLRQQDKIWENICYELKWQFIPSI